MHLVLIGDSVFDNGVYVDSQQSVTDHLRRLLPEGVQVTCLAVDGHLSVDAFGQPDRLPATTTHVALSSGGNDALAVIPLLKTPCATVMDALRQLNRQQQKFQRDYRPLKRRLKALRDVFQVPQDSRVWCRLSSRPNDFPDKEPGPNPRRRSSAYVRT